MRSHRKISTRAPKPESVQFADEPNPRISLFSRRTYPEPIFVECPRDEKDEDGGPVAIIWYPLGGEIFFGAHVNREDAQDLVDRLREAFPAELGFGSTPYFPGIK